MGFIRNYCDIDCTNLIFWDFSYYNGFRGMGSGPQSCLRMGNLMGQSVFIPVAGFMVISSIYQNVIFWYFQISHPVVQWEAWNLVLHSYMDIRYQMGPPCSILGAWVMVISISQFWYFGMSHLLMKWNLSNGYHNDPSIQGYVNCHSIQFPRSINMC